MLSGGVSLTVDSHLAVAVLLQQKLDVRAGRRDVLGPGSDPRAQPVSLVEEERKTAHGRPVVAEEEQRESHQGSPNTVPPLWSVFVCEPLPSLQRTFPVAAFGNRRQE